MTFPLSLQRQQSTRECDLTTTSFDPACILQVAIANDGRIFVADGYCNSRVMQFSPSGDYETEYRLTPGLMDVPHSLVLDECNDGLYVADREHSQVHKFSISQAKLQGVNCTPVLRSIHALEKKRKVYAVRRFHHAMA